MVLLDRINNILGMTPGRRGRLYGPSCALVGAALTSLAWIAVVGLPSQRQPRTSGSDGEGIVSKSEQCLSSEAKTKLATASTEQTPSVDKIIEIAEPLENPRFNSFWDLSLEEAIKTSTVNSKAMRSLRSRQGSPTCNSGSQAAAAQQAPAIDAELSEHTDDAASEAEVEIAIRDVVNNTKKRLLGTVLHLSQLGCPGRRA